MKKTLKNNLPFMILAGLMLVAVVFGTFFDYEISSAMAALSKTNYYSQNFFAAFFEIFGEMPVYIFPSMAIFCIMIFLRDRFVKSPAPRISISVVCVIVAVGLNYYAATRFIKASEPYFNLSSSLQGVYKNLFCLFFSATFSLVWYLCSSSLSKKCGRQNLKRLAICSLIVIFTAIICEAATHSLKPLFCRARYRFLFFVTENGLYAEGAEYTKWFLISKGRVLSEKLLSAGVESDAFRSFPSGHSTSAAMLLSLTLLPYTAEIFDTKKYKILTFALAVGLSLTVMAARIVAGAHYLTDVCAGFFITFASFILVRAVAFKIFNKALKE